MEKVGPAGGVEGGEVNFCVDFKLKNTDVLYAARLHGPKWFSVKK